MPPLPEASAVSTAGTGGATATYHPCRSAFHDPERSKRRGGLVPSPRRSALDGERGRGPDTRSGGGAAAGRTAKAARHLIPEQADAMFGLGRDWARSGRRHLSPARPMLRSIVDRIADSCDCPQTAVVAPKKPTNLIVQRISNDLSPSCLTAPSAHGKCAHLTQQFAEMDCGPKLRLDLAT